jgi:hypothetical protein
VKNSASTGSLVTRAPALRMSSVSRSTSSAVSTFTRNKQLASPHPIGEIAESECAQSDTREPEDVNEDCLSPAEVEFRLGLLEAYYEPMFSGRSHGFRPGRGCHTALREVAETWTGTTWFIEADISDCFGSFDHRVVVKILSEKIHDERFLRLMRNMLDEAGYLEDWTWNATLSGVPQGGVVTPPTQWAMSGMVVLRVGVGGGLALSVGRSRIGIRCLMVILSGPTRTSLTSSRSTRWRSSTVDSSALAWNWVRKPSRSEASLR